MKRKDGNFLHLAQKQKWKRYEGKERIGRDRVAKERLLAQDVRKKWKNRP